jgi:hypothetical protein
MRNNDRFFDKAFLYYGSYKGIGAIFGLFWLFFVTIPIRLIRYLVRASQR